MLKVCTACGHYTEIDECLKECHTCLGHSEEVRSYRRKQRQKEYEKQKRVKRQLLALGRSIDNCFILGFVIIMLISFTATGCVRTKVFEQSRKDIVQLAENHKALAQDHLILSVVVAKGFKLNEENTNKLLKNPSLIYQQSKDTLQTVKEHEQVKPSIFSFESIKNGFYSVLEMVEPAVNFVTNASTALGVPAPIAGAAGTALLGLAGWLEKKRRADIEKEKINTEIAGRQDPTEREKYLKLKQQVISEKKKNA